MRDLIKKVIKEYVEPKVIFRVVGNVGKYINESNSKFNPQIPREIYSLINDKVKEVNPFYGFFTDKKTGEEKKVEFKINVTKHYIDRIFRLSDPEHQLGGKKYNPKIVNPNPLEGVDLLIINKDRLAEEILTKRIKDGDEVEVIDVDGSKFSMIVIFDDDSRNKNILKYTLHLKNQMKGDTFYKRRNQKTLKLHSVVK